MKKFLVIILIVMSGCKHVTKVNGGHVQKRYTEFSIELPNENWLAQPYDGTDLFFEHKHKPASIFVSSQCEKISDSPLVALSAQLLVGFSDIQIVSQKNISLNEREALISEVLAKLDGVARYLKIMVFKKNRCVYDIVLNQKAFDEETNEDFDKLIQSFTARADL